jgi:hypothetical protein
MTEDTWLRCSEYGSWYHAGWFHVGDRCADIPHASEWKCYGVLIDVDQPRNDAGCYQPCETITPGGENKWTCSIQ